MPTIQAIDNSLRKVGYSFGGTGNIAVWHFGQEIVHAFSFSIFTIIDRQRRQASDIDKRTIKSRILLQNNDLFYEMFWNLLLPSFQYFGHCKKYRKGNFETINLSQEYVAWALREFSLDAKRRDGKYLVRYTKENREKETVSINPSKLKRERDRGKCIIDEMALRGLFTLDFVDGGFELSKEDYVGYLKTERELIPNTNRGNLRRRKVKRRGRECLKKVIEVMLTRAEDGRRVKGKVIEISREGCKVLTSDSDIAKKCRYFNLFRGRNKINLTFH